MINSRRINEETPFHRFTGQPNTDLGTVRRLLIILT